MKREREMYSGRKTGKAENRDFISGQKRQKKGAQSADEEGKYRSTAAATTATGLAAV